MLNYKIFLFKVIQPNLVCKSFVTKFNDKLSRDSMTEPLSRKGNEIFRHFSNKKTIFCFKFFALKLV